MSAVRAFLVFFCVSIVPPIVDAGSARCGRGSRKLCRSDHSDEYSLAEHAGASYMKKKQHVASPRASSVGGVIAHSLLQARTTRSIAKWLPGEKSKTDPVVKRTWSKMPDAGSLDSGPLPEFNPFTPDTNLLVR